MSAPLSILERRILRHLLPAPAWLRWMGPYKALLPGLQKRGLIEPVTPAGGKARTMVGLTTAGRRLANTKDA